LQSLSNVGNAAERSSSDIHPAPNAYSTSKPATADKKTQHPSSVTPSHGANRYQSALPIILIFVHLISIRMSFILMTEAVISADRVLLLCKTSKKAVRYGYLLIV